MGWFSSKKKKIVGVANSRLIPKGENPQVLKDSVASYISDYGKTNGGINATMVDYMNQGIDQSIVFGSKRLNRWVKKPGKYSSVGGVIGELQTQSAEDFRNSMAAHLRAKHNSPILFYYLNNEEYDYAHFVRQVLKDRYSYNPSANTIVYQGSELYLEDAVIRLSTNEGLFPYQGPSFTAGYTPYRTRDITRAYSPSNTVINPSSQFNTFDVIAVNELSIDTFNSIQETTVVTTPETGDPTTVVTSKTLSTKVVNNIPSAGKISQTYVRRETLSEETSSKTIEDAALKTVTTIKVFSDVLKEFYKCNYKFNDTFSNYFYSQNIDWKTLTEAQVKALLKTIKEPDLRMQIGYEYSDTTGKPVVVYSTPTELETNFLESSNTKKAFGNFMPNLYFKIDFKYVNTDIKKPIYKEGRQYGKKIGLNIKDLIKEMKKEVDNQDKIMYTYFKFGVNVHSDDEVDQKYLFYFFEKYFRYCDTKNIYGIDYNFLLNTEYALPGKYLNFKDKVLKYDVSTARIGYFTGLESINPVGTVTKITGISKPSQGSERFQNIMNNLYNFYISYRLQVTSDRYEEYRVYGISANHYVTEGKWAESGGDNSDLLLPVDFDLLARLKGFKERERFLYNTMYVEFLTLVIQKVKWYQRGVFKLVILAVSVAITVFTGGAGVTVASVLMATLTNVAIGFAIDIGINILVKILSPELLKILGIALVAAGLAFGHSSALKGLQNISTKAFTILTMKADLLVKLGTKIVSSAMSEEINVIKESYLKEAKIHKDRMEDLDKYRLANSKYAPNTKLGYLDEEIRYNPPMLGESMDDMIRRSLNSNPALVTINYVHGYVDFLLELPTISETAYKQLEEDK